MKNMNFSVLNERKPDQSGVTLLEFLVAVIVLSLGLLGLAGLQMSALNSVQNSAERSIAIMLTSSILDAMRANVKVREVKASVYNYNDSGCAIPEDPSSLAQKEVKTWLDSIQDSLGPSACGSITCDANDICAIDIRWKNEDIGNGNFSVKTTGVQL